MLVDGAGPDKGYEAHGARHCHGVPFGDGLQLRALAVLPHRALCFATPTTTNQEQCIENTSNVTSERSGV